MPSYEMKLKGRNKRQKSNVAELSTLDSESLYKLPYILQIKIPVAAAVDQMERLSRLINEACQQGG